MKKLAAILLVVLISPFLSLPNRLQPSFRNFLSEHTGTKEKKLRMIFATFAENQEQLEHVFILAESIRNFAGNFRNAPVWIYVPEDSSVFPMTTPADKKTIRPYFNAGLLVVRPERGVLRKWAESFPKLYQDPVLVEMCDQDQYKKIFLHQAALAGAILSLLQPEEMTELPEMFNYPLFFHEKFSAERKFDSLDGVVTLRYDVYFRNLTPGWSQRLKGPTEIISWLKTKFSETSKK